MNKCKKCNVVILDDTDRCPLCKHVLESDGIPGEGRGAGGHANGGGKTAVGG